MYNRICISDMNVMYIDIDIDVYVYVFICTYCTHTCMYCVHMYTENYAVW